MSTSSQWLEAAVRLLSCLIISLAVVSCDRQHAAEHKTKTPPSKNIRSQDSLAIMASSVLSDSGNYRVSIVPLESEFSLQQMHSWAIRIFDAKTDAELQPYSVSLNGGMPSHGHGLPTQPTLSHYDKDHGFIVKGVRFNMPGEWFLSTQFEHTQGRDSAVINLIIVAGSKPTLAGNRSGQTVAHETHNADISWSLSEIQLLKSLALTPNSLALNQTGNQWLENEAAAELGHRLFFDTSLGKNALISCASCHQPEQYFTDTKATAHGLGALGRNTPSIVAAATHRWLYWDGRRDSTWSQALVPIEAAAEMGSSRVALVSTIIQHYQTEYESLFGSLHRATQSLESLNKDQLNGNPLGSDEARRAWESIDSTLRHDINTVFSNIGKAIAAYEAKLMPAPGAFDRYVETLAHDEANDSANSHSDKLKNTLSAQEQAGLKLFISARLQCMNCHNGPLFSNQGFHNIGTGLGVTNLGASNLAESNLQPPTQASFDFGRMLGSQAVLMNEFNCRSLYSDGEKKDCAELTHINRHEIPGMMRGAFKVPGLRGLNMTAPYMHDGRFDTLHEVIEHYANPPAHVASALHELPAITELLEHERDNLIAFLKTLGNEIAADDKWLNKP